TVQFVIDGGTYGTPVALSGGTASVNDAALTAGTHTVTAVYSPDSDAFAPSTSGPYKQVVVQPTLAVTSFSVSGTQLHPGDGSQCLVGTVSVKGTPGDSPTAMHMDVIQNGRVVASGALTSSTRAALLGRPFPASGVLAITTPQHLVELT